MAHHSLSTPPRAFPETTPAAVPWRADSRFYLAPVGGAAWLIGIGVAAALDVGLGFWLLMAGVALVGAVALWGTGRYGLALAGVAALALGGARAVATVPRIDAGHVAYYNGPAAVTLRGEIVAEPEMTDTQQRLRVAARELVSDGQARPVEGVVFVQTGRYPAIEYGATVDLAGPLASLDSLGSDDFAAYLARQGFHSVMSYPEVLVRAVGGGSPLTRALLVLRGRGRAVIAAALPGPQAALLSGILLGDDSGLPRATSDAFQATGMTHIIAISGFNIALLIALLDRLSAPLLPRRPAALLIMALVLAYALLVGASMSVLRAALMGLAYLIGLRLLGRPTLAVAGLFTAAFAITLAQPNALWDVGFQLSFAATLGLMLYAGPWTQRLRGMADTLPRPALRLLSEGVVVTLAAQVLTLPLILYHFGRLSLVSLPANLLVLPAQPAVMLTGGAALLLGLVAPALGRVAALPAWLFLTYTLAVIERLATVEWASLPLRLSSWGLLAIYGVIGGVTTLAALARRERGGGAERRRPGAKAGAVLVSGAVVGLLAAAWWAERPDGRLHVAFLDVGQGDAILITSPGGRQVLIDGGRYPSVLLDELGEQMPFWDRSLDVLIATHPDDDHVAGLVSAAERYAVGQLVTNGAAAGSDPGYAALLAALGEGAVHAAREGEIIDLGDGARLEIVHAGGGGDTGSDNDASVVARLVYGQLSVLLTGDAEEPAEAAMLRSGRPLAAVVLKAGHHGANTSSSAPFLRAVGPQVIIISAGKGNRYGHPAPAMLARAAAAGAAVLRTDEVGTIEMVSDGQRMWWAAGTLEQ